MSEENILIVEDEALIAMELEERLRRLGHTNISRIFSGEEAVERALENPPRLIFMDIGLTGKLDGLEASKAICSRLNIPVIYITGSSEKMLLKRLQEANITHPFSYIIKPFNEKGLREKIKIVLGKQSSP